MPVFARRQPVNRFKYPVKRPLTVEAGVGTYLRQRIVGRPYQLRGALGTDQAYIAPKTHFDPVRKDP